MPEGPEIRRAADQVAGVLVGRRIERASFAFPELQRFEKRISGATVHAVDTRGKAMLTRFDNDLTLFSHNQLYGRWFIVRRDEYPVTRRSLRVALHTNAHSALLYSASNVSILDPDQLKTHPFLSRLGPDVLDSMLKPADIVRQLEHDRFVNRSLAALYLDQSFLAGLGNYLRSEILFVARIDPSLRPADLDTATRGRLARDTIEICRRAYRTGGRTLTAKAGGKKSDRFWVFARASRPCLACGTAIERKDFSGRRLYFCPRCQARSGS